ncbi:MAG: hypothetical protein AAF566_00435 [Pseudomonadota bacterium]
MDEDELQGVDQPQNDQPKSDLANEPDSEQPKKYTFDDWALI